MSLYLFRVLLGILPTRSFDRKARSDALKAALSPYMKDWGSHLAKDIFTSLGLMADQLTYKPKVRNDV
jgi:hypothetical protein